MVKDYLFVFTSDTIVTTLIKKLYNQNLFTSHQSNGSILLIAKITIDFVCICEWKKLVTWWVDADIINSDQTFCSIVVFGLVMRSGVVRVYFLKMDGFDALKNLVGPSN